MSEAPKNGPFELEIALRAWASSWSGESRRRPHGGPTDIYLCVVDHFEPQVGKPARHVARARLEHWLEKYPEIAFRYRDTYGRPATHSFFYPWDEYDEWEFTHLAELCAQGCGEIELHLHHRDDTEETLREKLQEAVSTYRAHGALTCWEDGTPAWAFIHGNWALANSRHDHGRNYCGVDNELLVLLQEGCYADFTFPAWQQKAQPRQVNSIYYAVDRPAMKPYEWGKPARVGVSNEAGLLLIQGPLSSYLSRGKWGPRLTMDDPDLAACRRYHPDRLDRWVRQGIHVQGRPDRIFIKLHSHGAADDNRAVMLGEDLGALYGDALSRYNDGTRYRMHFVTAREMFNVVKATEAEAPHADERLRDWVLPPPTYTVQEPAPAPSAQPVTISN